VLVYHTRVLDFDIKTRYFRKELEMLDEGIRLVTTRTDQIVFIENLRFLKHLLRDLCIL
jgi:hypothetical protein